MRIGFASIYSWRPHVEHLYFLSTLATRAGHETFFLTCDGDLPDCYSRELRGRTALRECLQCRLGGIRSFVRDNVASIGSTDRADESVAGSEHWVTSSASTLGRFESDADYDSPRFHDVAARLKPAAEKAYRSAKTWMTQNKLDAVCVFNGRIDATRAIFEAAQRLGCRVVSVERTWFGDGLQLYPEENCLGLNSVDALVKEWSDRPLTRDQAMKAARHVASRFLGTNINEWRAYNANAESLPWPTAKRGKRVLLLPGSRNEVWGHPDWVSLWADPTTAYDELMEHLGLTPQDVVLRCHPNWGEKIGKQDGRFSERYYLDWASRRGIFSFPSSHKVSTLGLIEQCDAIVIANGSAALEAGMLGKQVIGTGPAVYQEAGFRDRVYSRLELGDIALDSALPEDKQTRKSTNTMRKALRFCYTMAYRISQYTEAVRAESTTRYRYDISVDPERFLNILRSGKLEADDSNSALNETEEDSVLELIRRREWATLRRDSAAGSVNSLSRLRRRPMFRAIDAIGRWKPVGDR